MERLLQAKLTRRAKAGRRETGGEGEDCRHTLPGLCRACREGWAMGLRGGVWGSGDRKLHVLWPGVRTRSPPGPHPRVSHINFLVVSAEGLRTAS